MNAVRKEAEQSKIAASMSFVFSELNYTTSGMELPTGAQKLCLAKMEPPSFSGEIRIAQGFRSRVRYMTMT